MDPRGGPGMADYVGVCMKPRLAGWYVYQCKHEQEPGEGQEEDRLKPGAISLCANTTF